MTMREYPDGLDCVWLATDRNGHLGAFVTGGSGPIPVSATSDSSFPIEDIEAAVCELPQISETRLLVQMRRPDYFIDIAQRGFFVYDWRDVYEPVAVPLNPITLDALPESIRRLAVDATLRDSAFVEEQALDVMAMLECLSAD
ncbi:MAG: hypothetical protein JSS57_27060 [Proteobacteria bacterium]|nr:hypothetical protein [Pseudomonadota bacterium]